MLFVDLSTFPTLSTPRLLLRRITEEDTDRLLLLRSDPEVMRYLDRAPAKSKEEVLALIRKIQGSLTLNEGITWGIALKDNPALIGTIGFWRIIPERYRAEIGYLLDPAFQGKGLMQEAMEAVIRHGFVTLKLHSVEADVNPENAASIRLLEKNNFVKEAYFKEYHYYNGKFLDTVIYTLFSRQ
jgi:ribosomal-protein-alanine N-acetyltransferase